MIRDWENTTLGAFLQRDGGSIKTGPFGTTLKASEYSDNGVPLISVGEVGYGSLRIHKKTPRVPPAVTQRLQEYLLEAGDIVFGRKGAVDRSALVKDEEHGWFLGSDGIRLRLPSTCIPRFVAYQIQSLATRNWLIQHATGSTMPSLNQGIIERIPIVMPPLSVQKEVSVVLGSFDDKIELNRKLNETLEQMARAIFKSWFIDFDPVRAKAAGKEPFGMDDATASLFPNGFEKSDLGELPKGWSYSELGELVELVRGTTYKSALKGLPGPYLLGLGSIERNGGFRDGKLTTYGGDSPEKLLMRPGDIFVSLKDVTQSADLLGAVARVPEHIHRGRLTQDTVKLGFKTNRPFREIVYRTLLSQQYRDYCRSHATGTTNLGLAREDFLSYPILDAPDAILNAFNDLVTPLSELLEKNVIESKSLSEARDLLLPRLLSGEIRVKGVS